MSPISVSAAPLGPHRSLGGVERANASNIISQMRPEFRNGGISSQVQNAITGYKNAAATNATNQALNDDARRKNNENSNSMQLRTVLKIADNTAGGDYTTQRKLIRDISGVPQSVKDNFEKDYKTFYQTEKLVRDNKQGALDPLESLTASGITDKKKNYKINGKLPKQMTTLILPRGTATPGIGCQHTAQGKAAGKRCGC